MKFFLPNFKKIYLEIFKKSFKNLKQKGLRQKFEFNQGENDRNRRGTTWWG